MGDWYMGVYCNIILSIFPSIHWVSLVAQLVKNPPAMHKTLVQFLSQDDPLEKNKLPILVFLGFPGGSDGKKSTYSAGELGSIPYGWHNVFVELTKSWVSLSGMKLLLL